MAFTRFKADNDINDALVRRKKKTGGGGGGREQPPESQPWRRRFGICFTKTMPGSSRNRRSSGEDDGRNRGPAHGVWPRHNGGQD